MHFWTTVCNERPPNGVPWTGVPDRLADGFTIKKSKGVNTRVAVCEVRTNPDGWELRLTRDGQSLPICTIRPICRRNASFGRDVGQGAVSAQGRTVSMGAPRQMANRNSHPLGWVHTSQTATFN